MYYIIKKIRTMWKKIRSSWLLYRLKKSKLKKNFFYDNSFLLYFYLSLRSKIIIAFTSKLGFRSKLLLFAFFIFFFLVLMDIIIGYGTLLSSSDFGPAPTGIYPRSFVYNGKFAGTLEHVKDFHPFPSIELLLHVLCIICYNPNTKFCNVDCAVCSIKHVWDNTTWSSFWNNITVGPHVVLETQLVITIFFFSIFIFLYLVYRSQLSTHVWAFIVFHNHDSYMITILRSIGFVLAIFGFYGRMLVQIAEMLPAQTIWILCNLLKFLYNNLYKKVIVKMIIDYIYNHLSPIHPAWWIVLSLVKPYFSMAFNTNITYFSNFFTLNVLIVLLPSYKLLLLIDAIVKVVLYVSNVFFKDNFSYISSRINNDYINNIYIIIQSTLLLGKVNYHFWSNWLTKDEYIGTSIFDCNSIFFVNLVGIIVLYVILKKKLLKKKNTK